jgi:hypothetical protein
MVSIKSFAERAGTSKQSGTQLGSAASYLAHRLPLSIEGQVRTHSYRRPREPAVVGVFVAAAPVVPPPPLLLLLPRRFPRGAACRRLYDGFRCRV